MKKMLFFALFAGMLVAVHAQDDALSIVRASRDRIQAETVSTRSRMVIRTKDGSTSERLIDQYAKDGPKGTRTVIVFQQPASVAGTRFLTMENPGNADDRWIFLPNLGRVRRIAASEGSGSFVGTDFSYDDVSSATRNANLDTHTLLREEDYDSDGINAATCYVIQSIPKDSSYQYSKMVQWIAKDTRIVMKIELFDRRNTLVKTVEMSGLKDVQGRLTVTVTKMTTHAAGTSTTITNEIIKYDDPIPERVFTTEFLETGRSR
ncbi:MAG: outer membrane lipoprotein-sorting protein [Treponema sp.]|nr:outer membrane lipoprotein-sorting protein [Treponema sp.]